MDLHQKQPHLRRLDYHFVLFLEVLCRAHVVKQIMCLQDTAFSEDRNNSGATRDTKDPQRGMLNEILKESMLRNGKQRERPTEVMSEN